jgi:predicted XRE-type DNA-binding protein
MTNTNAHIGSSFDDFLREDGVYEEATTQAVKRVIAWQIDQRRRQSGLSKTAMALRMGTSRMELNRVLDPDNDKVRLDTLRRAAMAVGSELRVELV